MLTREQAIAALESVRRVMCCYASPGACDCKYGAYHGIRVHAPNSTLPRGEITGCCELREMVELLLCIKDSEFKKLNETSDARALKKGRAWRRAELDKIIEEYGAGVYVPEWLANFETCF